MDGRFARICWIICAATLIAGTIAMDFNLVSETAAHHAAWYVILAITVWGVFVRARDRRKSASGGPKPPARE